MVFKCAKGMYELQKNYRDAFNLEAFIEKYLEECFDKDMYIVGDISSEILRLKGFNTDPKSDNYFGFIDDYLDISCAFGCPYYVLKRIRNEDEYHKLEKLNKEPITTDDRITIHPMEKENFDKESLILKTSHKGKPNIVIDSRKINAIPLGKLPDDLKDDKDIPTLKGRQPEKKEEPVIVQTFVSSSEDFDPSKKQDRRRNNNRPNKGNPNNNPNRGNGPRPQQGQPKNVEPNKNIAPKEGSNPNPNNNRNRNKNRNKGRNNGPKGQNEDKGKE